MPQPVQISIRILPRAGRIPATPPGGSPAGAGIPAVRTPTGRFDRTGRPARPTIRLQEGSPLGSRGKALRFMGLSKVCGILEAAGYWRVGTVWLGRKPGRWKRNRQRRSISSTMKTKWILTATMWGLGAMLVVGMSGCGSGGSTADAKPYPLDVCLVSGEKLGSHGAPYVFVHEGQQIKLCCKGCLKDFRAEPVRHLQKLASGAGAGGANAVQAP